MKATKAQLAVLKRMKAGEVLQHHSSGYHIGYHFKGEGPLRDWRTIPCLYDKGYIEADKDPVNRYGLVLTPAGRELVAREGK